MTDDTEGVGGGRKGSPPKKSPPKKPPPKTETTTRVERGKSGVRAVWSDVAAEMARTRGHDDPPAEKGRDGLAAGQWPGYPTDRLPPGCPIVPLGIKDKTTYFVDTSGQLISIGASEWGKKMVLQLFAGHHNFLRWAWPKWSSPKGPKDFTINGVEVDEVMSCLLTVAQRRGIFSPSDRVRGRGAWSQMRSDGHRMVDEGVYAERRGEQVSKGPHP